MVGGLAAYAIAAAAIAWGEAAGWDERAFRVYYAAGALLTAPLLGAGSLLLAGRCRAAPVVLVYAGLAVGIALAVPVHGAFAAHGIPAAQDHLDFIPARLLAIVANIAGTLAVVVVALRSFRRRPLGNGLIIAGIVAAATGAGSPGSAPRQRNRDRGRCGAALRRIRRSCAHSVVFLAQNGPSLSHKRCLNKARTWQCATVVHTDRISRAERCSPQGVFPPARPPTCSRPGRYRLRRSILACGLLLAFAGMATAAAAATATKNSQGQSETTTSTTTGTTVGTTESRQGASRWELRTAAASRRHIQRFRADTKHG